MEVNEWKKIIELERKQKNEFFKMHPQSPLSFEIRQKFEGLSYYPLDPDYRFELELYEHENKEVLKIEDTQGNQREFLRWGEFRCKINDKECTVQVYKNDPQEERLFIPFRDQTSGKKTYGAGRYIDLDVETQQTSEGKWILDFNQAYNPWCAYSELYACPYVPNDNWLNVSIKAGEKNFNKE
ncbi:MAG: DUF1684 domain-containing protein [bacterium]